MLQKLIYASVAAAALALSAQPGHAGTIAGTTSGSFSGLNSCDNTGGTTDCRIVNSGTQVQWGTESGWGVGSYHNPSTLTAISTSFGPVSTPAVVTFGQLQWNNTPIRDYQNDLNSLGVNWSVTIDFSQPNAVAQSETFNLTIQNTQNPPGDNTTGLTLADLADLQSKLNTALAATGTNTSVSGLAYSLKTGQTGTTLTGNCGAGGSGACTWNNNESHIANLYLVGTVNQSTAIPEPMSLALLGAGLGALGLVRRARKAA